MKIQKQASKGKKKPVERSGQTCFENFRKIQSKRLCQCLEQFRVHSYKALKIVFVSGYFNGMYRKTLKLTNLRYVSNTWKPITCFAM